jgi:carboxypeptidase PM20D1
LIHILLVVVVLKTITFKSLQVKTQSATLPVPDKDIVKNLSVAITFRTISYDANSPIDTLAFDGYHQFLAEAYPLLHLTLKKETSPEFSLLYTWQGTNPALKPAILTAHMDVVDAADPDTWTKPPFSGENDGTYIWRRGTLDDKGDMNSIFEVVE